MKIALAQWIERQPAQQMVKGSIPGHGHMAGLQVWSSAPREVKGKESLW